MDDKQTIRVVLYQADGIWLAQGLELDICAQGPDAATAKRRFALTCNFESSEREERFGDPTHGLDSAPQRFFELWNKAELSLMPEHCSDGREVDYRLAA